jgi:hypothetical protein
MEALHDVVKAGKARYIGASSMWAWQFAKMQHTADRNDWTRFISMQNQYSLLQREEEREMFGLLADRESAGPRGARWPKGAQCRGSPSVPADRTPGHGHNIELPNAAGVNPVPPRDQRVAGEHRHGVRKN